MRVVNPKKMNANEMFICGKIMAKYLMKNGAYSLSNLEDKYYFSRNDELKGIYDLAPFYLKVLERW